MCTNPPLGWASLLIAIGCLGINGFASFVPSFCGATRVTEAVFFWGTATGCFAPWVDILVEAFCFVVFNGVTVASFVPSFCGATGATEAVFLAAIVTDGLAP